METPTNLADPGSPEAVSVEEFLKLVVDRRQPHSPLLRNIYNKLVPYVPKQRAPLPNNKHGITGITLHQTACDMGERWERYDTISVHYVILRSGTILWMCDEDKVLFGGNGWNARCIQIEVNGRYPGLEDDPKTVAREDLRTTWNDPSTKEVEQPQKVTAEAMRSLRMLARYLKHKFPTVEFLVAHRQSSLDREADPGQAIWAEAVKVKKELGLTSGGKGFKLNTGFSLPLAWDPTEGLGGYYG